MNKEHLPEEKQGDSFPNEKSEISSADEKKTANVKEFEAELEKLSKEKDEYLDGWKRSKADLINYKKDELRRLEEVAKFGSEEVMRDLISVLDSFELALSTLEKSDAKVEKGIYMIKNQLEDILKRRGLQRIKVAKGDKFDPSYHEAIGSVEEVGSSGAIAEEIEAGYMLYDKVLRPTRVKLFK